MANKTDTNTAARAATDGAPSVAEALVRLKAAADAAHPCAAVARALAQVQLHY